MKLQEIKGTYDTIYSLGDLCLASIQLKQNKLRPFSGVLDWMASPQLHDVNRLLRYRFEEFMNPSNLRIIGYAGEDKICVADDFYNMVSNHDFDVGNNSLTLLSGYPEVKEKFDRRIRRFLHKAATSKKMLFVRTEGDLEDAAELQDVLYDLVRYDFRVLIVNHTNVDRLVEDNWPLKRVCSVQLPAANKWTDNNHLWTRLLQGVHTRD
ncbi:DUF1796 family putative cysteine peptidase [Cohnella terricola]|uniref:Peptidase n=1 Tax=Cohnella terricola TaxID=1289167 RepID=A0A559JQJ6_9BACL|nr:DUF1796 family putative cysteine peptidase [Cohnella terricola]TVY02156.1 peptidase [Cohnella terricola]